MVRLVRRLYAHRHLLNVCHQNRDLEDVLGVQQR
jgi:hypothetical protein